MDLSALQKVSLLKRERLWRREKEGEKESWPERAGRDEPLC